MMRKWLSPSSGRRAGQLSLWIFAFIGFLAASLQIGEYLSQPKSSLEVQVIEHKYVNPVFVHKAFGTLQYNSPLGRMSAKLKQLECGEAPSEGNKEIIIGYLDTLDCEGAKRLTHALNFVTYDDYGPGVISEIRVKNVGSSPASNIRISGSYIKYVELVISSRNRQEIKETASAYVLPPLNPGEEWAAYVWSDAFIGPDGIKVTFAGGLVDFDKLVPASTKPVGIIPFVLYYLTWGGRIFLVVVVIVLAALIAAFYRTWQEGKPSSELDENPKT